MSFTGMFNTSNFTTDLAKKSFAGMITRLMPNGTAPLFGLTSMLPSETAVQVEHGFFAKMAVFPSFTLGAAIGAAADTTLTVVSTANILPGMIFRSSTAGVANLGENLIVNAVVNATTLTVSRAQGTVAANTCATAGVYLMVGNAFEEGSVRPNALNITPIRVTNYTQIFRNSWAITDTVRATLVIAGDSNVAESKQDCAAFHAADIEKALFFGQKSASTRNGQPFRTMAGLIPSITDATLYISGSYAANTTIAGGTTNYTQLETALDPVFDQATDPKVANERVMFVGGLAKKVLNNIGRLNGTYMMVDGQTSYGLQFSTFKTARGTFRVIEHPLFNTNAIWGKMAVVVDLSTFSLAYLGDRKTQSADFSSDNDDGVDAVGGTLTTELTTLVKNPAANAIVYGLTAAAAG
jgi:hypothetical protein